MDLKEVLGEAYRDGMTAEEITEALKKVNLVDPSKVPEGVPKETFDKTASEVSKLKKQLKEKMSEEERLSEEQKQREEDMQKLQKENAILKTKEKFLSNGYDGETASKLAEAFGNGDMDAFSEINATYLQKREDSLKAAVKEELLNKTPGIAGGAGGSGEEDSGVEFASELGKAAAKSNEITAKVFQNYGIGG